MNKTAYRLYWILMVCYTLLAVIKWMVWQPLVAAIYTVGSVALIAMLVRTRTRNKLDQNTDLQEKTGAGD